MTIAVVGFLLSVYFMMEYEILGKDTIDGRYYGNTEVKLIRIYQEGDEMGFNLNYFSGEAFKKSLLRLSEKAGWSKTEGLPDQCLVNGVVLLQDYCRPDLRGQLKIEFMNNFNELINEFKKENNKYGAFNDEEVIVSGSFIEGKSKKEVLFENLNDKNKVWSKRKVGFRVEIKDFEVFERIWGAANKCSLSVDDLELKNCFKNNGFNAVTKDLGGYYLVLLDTGKRIFYLGQPKIFEIKFLVQKQNSDQ